MEGTSPNAQAHTRTSSNSAASSACRRRTTIPPTTPTTASTPSRQRQAQNEGHGFADVCPKVSPTQLHGIEINTYAAELAHVSIWIGYLKWKRENGLYDKRKPILHPLDTIEHRDAILEWLDEKESGAQAGGQRCPRARRPTDSRKSPPAESRPRRLRPVGPVVLGKRRSGCAKTRDALAAGLDPASANDDNSEHTLAGAEL